MAELPAYPGQHNLSRLLVVTDPVIAQPPFFNGIVSRLEKGGTSVEVFADVHKNPVKSDVYKGTQVWDNTDRDCIIADDAVAPAGAGDMLLKRIAVRVVCR